MAVVTAYTAINMSNWTFYETDTLVIADTQITEYHTVGRTTYYYGSGFTGNESQGVTGGTLNAIHHFLGDVEQYRVTGLSHSAATVSSYLEVDDPGILPFLFSGKDTFVGSAGADRLNGYNGNDTMDGRGGPDRINGGAGNDTLVYGAGDTLNGSSGTLDTLKIKVANVDLSNNTANPNTRLLNFEQIDMRNGDHTLKLAKADVLDMSSTSTIKILGDSGDTVTIVGAQVEGGSAPAGFTRYTIGSAILIVDSDIHVT